MPNCEVALYREGKLLRPYHLTKFKDDFNSVIQEAAYAGTTNPDMAIVWIGMRAFAFWYRGWETKQMLFKIKSKMVLSGTDLVWPAGCVVTGIPAINQPNWWEELKFFIDHPYRTYYTDSSDFLNDTDPESMLITCEEFRQGQVEVIPVY
jgi:hypothetical protein